jgi:ubiquinone/menaquinone biosynthesis C-methylase UbiE
VLGDGDGRFLARLLEANPTLTADVVDSSQSMLALLEQRIRSSGAQPRRRICLHHADALEWNLRGSYDLIVSHFFLDCFFPYQLELLFDRVLPHTLPEARWVISEFAIPRNPIAAYLARGIIGLLYRSFGLLAGLPVRALPEYASPLLSRGLVLSHNRRYLGGLLCSQVWTRPN